MSRTGAATAAARRRLSAGRPATRRRPHTGATTRFRPPSSIAVPRRLSGPRPGSRTGAAAGLPARVRRALRALAALPDLAVVDRAVRGRAWIAVVGTLLIGIVALQVSMLKLNAGIGRAVERTTALERDNARLEAMLSGMSSSPRIRAKAEKLGLVMPDVDRIRYVSAGGPGPPRAAAAALAAGAFAPPGAQQGPGGQTAAVGGNITPEQAQAMLNDGDPSNDTEAMLNDGDPSNDAAALAGNGDASGDTQASTAGNGDASGDTQASTAGN